jgi:hypothetical protein
LYCTEKEKGRWAVAEYWLSDQEPFARENAVVSTIPFKGFTIGRGQGQMTDTSVRRTAPLPNTEVDTPIGSDS